MKKIQEEAKQRRFIVGWFLDVIYVGFHGVFGSIRFQFRLHRIFDGTHFRFHALADSRLPVNQHSTRRSGFLPHRKNAITTLNRKPIDIDRMAFLLESNTDKWYEVSRSIRGIDLAADS